MKIPVSWLREYADLPDDASAIGDRLAMLGFPIEELARRPSITNVVVGRIVAIERHPNADKLQVCTVDVGTDRALTIVTAATNVAHDQRIPVATIGARLPRATIERRTMRGLASEGMLCSPDELALPPEWFEQDGIMQLDADAPIGVDAVDWLRLGGDVLDVEITSNRVDAMCAIGLARELAASYGLGTRLPSFENPGHGKAMPAPRVDVETRDCRRFVLQRFDDVRAGVAPVRMRVRLALCGVRPINSLVDVSNYVMLETGQPLHFYDASRVVDQHLIAREARQDERLITLDGIERALTPAALVIADEREVLGLAGVMGGAASEVTESTSSILLEAANFSGARVRAIAAHFSLRTEASSRHEKRLAPALADIGAARAAQLLVEQGARAYAPEIAGIRLSERDTVSLRAKEVQRLLGLPLEPQRIARHLVSLGCKVKERDGELAVTVPAWRTDLEVAADLVEEVARIEGYDAIEAAEPAIPSHAISSEEYEREGLVARTMLALGYHETITHSLRRRSGERAIELRNPLSEDQRYLRTDIASGLLEALVRVGAPYRIFEIGHVFEREGAAVVELPFLTFAYGVPRVEEPPWRDEEFLRLHGDCAALLRSICGGTPRIAAASRPGLHPGKCGIFTIDDAELAVAGRVDPRTERSLGSPFALYLASVRLDRLPTRPTPHYRVPSRYPSTFRDLALSVGVDVNAAEIQRVCAEAIGDVCTSVRVFDEYRGPQIEAGRKSLALRAVMQRFDGTITDDEADAAVARATKALGDRFGAAIRQ
jgi:phenylalanyl-tRNA synthetase beta chain